MQHKEWINYIQIGHDYNTETKSDNGHCWYFANGVLFTKENTNHSEWFWDKNDFPDLQFACGRIDSKREVISLVNYELSPSQIEYLKKKLFEKFLYKVVEF